MVSTLDWLARARWQAARVVPYLSRSLWAMRFIETEDVATCAIDERWRVYVNPAYIQNCAKNGTLLGEVLHECLHPTLRHGPRAKAIRADNHRRWNGCADAELDQQIEAAGVQLVDKRIRPEDFGGHRGMTAEELYRLGSGSDHAGRCAGGSGTGALAHPCEHKAPPTIAGLSEGEAEIVRAIVAYDIRKYVKSRGAGSVPNGLVRWAEQWGEPVPIDWHALVIARLQYALDSRRGPAASFARPARRSFPGGLVLPVYRSPVPSIALVIDSSASMTDDQIGQGLACVFDAAEVLGRVWVVSCDARATDPVEVRHIDDLRGEVRGGGGTDMRVGIARALDIMPDAIVVVTDGETPWPQEEPEVPVTIVLTSQPPSSMPPPVWAEVISIPDDEQRTKVGTP
jgi:predicted metal-dependent peptidase